jgi:N-carbamoylputrescine amidase
LNETIGLGHLLRIALVQQHASSDRDENIARGLFALTEAAQHGAELVCFAELAFERFHPQSPADGPVVGLAQPVPGPLTDAFTAAAREQGVVVVLNLFERDGQKTFDTSPVIDADGTLLGRTRMVHITDYPCFHEQDYYAPGDTGAPVYTTAVGSVGVAICYDRHYPEYMRALALSGAEIVVVPQAGVEGEWPDGLYEAEMRVAAFQNGYFVALCNRVGEEENLACSGESFVCAPDGTVTARSPSGEDSILYADVDLNAVHESHARRLFLRDRRPSLYPKWLASADPACNSSV